MSDFTKIILRKNSLKKNCQNLTVEEIEKAILDLQEIQADKVAQEEAAKAANAEREAAIENLRSQMEEMGLSIDDLAGAVTGQPKKKVEAKYRLEDEDGEIHDWSGRGRTPVIYKQAIENGASLEDFLIQE